MYKSTKNLLISTKAFHRTLCDGNKPNLHNQVKRGVDWTKNVVYGGDLATPISRESVGTVLFNRMLVPDRRDDVFQICASSKISMTTKEFLEKSVGVAQKLKEEGVHRGDFIILVGNNSLFMNVALVGIVFTGAVPVPLSYNTGFKEFETITKSLKPKFFGCDKKYLNLFRKAFNTLPEFDNSRIFLLDREREVNEPGIISFEEFVKGRGGNFESFQPSQVKNSEEELVLGIGSISEVPNTRIVGITHYNTNSIIAQYDSVDRQRHRKEIILMVTKTFWLTGLYPLLLASCYGSKLIVMDSFDEEAFLNNINDYKVTTTFLFSSKCWKLYRYTPKCKYDLCSCKQVHTDDGSLPKTLIDGWKEKFGITLRPSYGLTEVTGFALRPPIDFFKEKSSGQLVPNLYGKVISLRTSRNVGPLEPGEICFKGPSVTTGYINDKKANMVLFDRDGFLLTGHYGYYDEDGDFFIIDKIINQIKYKNHKISPRELEGIIKTLEPIVDVCVTGIPHHEDGEHPVAFVTIEQKQRISEKIIMNFVNSQVPDHKRIRAVIFLPKIPKFRHTGTVKRNLFSKILSKYRIKEGILLKY